MLDQLLDLLKAEQASGALIQLKDFTAAFEPTGARFIKVKAINLGKGPKTMQARENLFGFLLTKLRLNKTLLPISNRS